MTGTHDKIRSLFLAALMVTSVFVGAVALTGSAFAADANDADANWVSDSTRWQGQDLYFDSDTGSDGVVQIRENDDGDIGTLVREVNLDDDGSAIVSTDNLEGEYYMTDGAGNVYVTGTDGVADSTTDTPDGSQAVEVAVQTLSVEAEDDSVAEDDAPEFNVDSNRAQFDLIVSSDDLDEEDLDALFTTALTDSETSMDLDDDEVLIEDVGSGDNALPTTDFATAEIDAGNYSFDFEVADTGVSSSTDIQVGEEGDAEATIVEDSYRQDRGDFLRFTVELENIDSNRATLAFGGEDAGYRSVAVIEDGDEDGVVNVTINTFYAGRGDTTDPNVWAAGGDDSVEKVVRTTPEAGDSLTDVLEAGSYNIRSYSGDHIDAGEDETDGETEDDVSVAIIRERPEPSASSRVAPDDPIGGYGDGPHDSGVDAESSGAQELYEASAERSEIADGDNAVVQFDISGIYGFFQGKDSFVNPTGAERDLFLNITQTNRDRNQEAKVIAMSPNPDADPGDADEDFQGDASEFDVYTNAFQNRFFVVIDTDGDVPRLNEPSGDTYEIESGDEYRASLTLDEDNSLLGASSSEETASTDFSIVDAEAAFDEQSGVADFDGDGSADDGIAVPKSEDGAITGTSTLAPGTSLSYEVESSDGEEVFFLAGTADVNDDGSFEIPVDLSNRTAGTTFEARITSPVEASADGVITQPASVSIDDQTVTAGSDQTLTVASATLSSGGFVTIHDGTLADGEALSSVRGTSDYLEPGDHEDIEVSLDTPYEEDGTAIAMPHMDTNGNEEYDFVSSEGDDDTPYTDADGAVTDDASITVESGTTTTTSTTTSTTSTTEATSTTQSTTTTSSGTTSTSETTTTTGPGFGIVVALIALIGAALLAVRRRE